MDAIFVALPLPPAVKLAVSATHGRPVAILPACKRHHKAIQFLQQENDSNEIVKDALSEMVRCTKMLVAPKTFLTGQLRETVSCIGFDEILVAYAVYLILRNGPESTDGAWAKTVLETYIGNEQREMHISAESLGFGEALLKCLH
jgi:hypothetical protein